MITTLAKGVLSMLTPEERVCLLEIAKGPLRTAEIPPEQLVRLMELGLVDTIRFEPVLTDAGERLLRGR
jgi:hypothetical protein